MFPLLSAPVLLIFLTPINLSTPLTSPSTQLTADTTAVQASQGTSKFACAQNVVIDAITGADGTASEIGWAHNYQAVVTCLGGSFYIQDGLNKSFTFGIYNGGATQWSDVDGYLPAQITVFHPAGATVRITEFADVVDVAHDPYVAVYCRVAITNNTTHTMVENPEPSPGLVTLGSTSDVVNAHTTVTHDYVVAADRFGHLYPWPTAQQLQAGGSFDNHFRHMRKFWNAQLAHIASVHLPDRSLVDAYRSGFIYTQIARSGTHLNTGVNGYDAEFSHDVIGILANLFTQGDYESAHALLLEARHVVGSQGEYVDGTWTYAWPWAIYLMKTGDLKFVQENFSTSGPAGSSEPSIEEAAHQIATGRTGPGGIMGMTDDIDTNGYWTIDDYEALMGLAAYRYLAQKVGNAGETKWATSEYNSLLTATNNTLEATIQRYHLTYLPCSMLQPNTANRCKNPEDANWAAPFLFGRWAWDAPLFGATVDGPGLGLIDATYSYGFDRLHGRLPANTFGGYPGDYYSTAYNAGYGSWGLASQHHRDQGILSYEFMLANTQSGPLSWWESSSAPSHSTPWVGRHPATGQGSSPHAWGMANDNMVLLDSLVAQESNGDLIVGRGVPNAWLAHGRMIEVTDFPATYGKRIGIKISSNGTSIRLSVRGSRPSGTLLFQLPVFVHNISSSSAGVIDQASGTVSISSSTSTVTVRLDHSVK